MDCPGNCCCLKYMLYRCVRTWNNGCIRHSPLHDFYTSFISNLLYTLMLSRVNSWCTLMYFVCLKYGSCSITVIIEKMFKNAMPSISYAPANRLEFLNEVLLSHSDAVFSKYNVVNSPKQIWYTTIKCLSLSYSFITSSIPYSSTCTSFPFITSAFFLWTRYAREAGDV